MERAKYDPEGLDMDLKITVEDRTGELREVEVIHAAKIAEISEEIHASEVKDRSDIWEHIARVSEDVLEIRTRMEADGHRFNRKTGNS